MGCIGAPVARSSSTDLDELADSRRLCIRSLTGPSTRVSLNLPLSGICWANRAAAGRTSFVRRVRSRR
jgi:hypothetical protein